MRNLIFISMHSTATTVYNCHIKTEPLNCDHFSLFDNITFKDCVYFFILQILFFKIWNINKNQNCIA